MRESASVTTKGEESGVDKIALFHALHAEGAHMGFNSLRVKNVSRRERTCAGRNLLPEAPGALGHRGLRMQEAIHTHAKKTRRGLRCPPAPVTRR